MNQTAFNYDIYSDEFSVYGVRITSVECRKYPDNFFKWLRENDETWYCFEAKALQMAARRKKYSARTIIEVLRWHSDLSDTTKEVKLPNNMTPGLARLWMAKHGKKYPKFFIQHNALGLAE